MPDKIKARFRITTPMFIGDAHQQASGISPTAVKGALRFWWRALNWGRLRNMNDATDESALRLLHQEEAVLFGAAASKERKLVGQSKFLLKLRPDEEFKYQRPDFSQPGVQYLLGQGLARSHSRKAVKPCFVTLELVMRPNTTVGQHDQLVEAIKAFGLFGGLGSRARKGFGSMAIDSLHFKGKKGFVPQNLSDVKGFLKSLQFSSGLPPFSAFSSETKVEFSVSGTGFSEVLNIVGEELQFYRSYGLNNRVMYRGSSEIASRKFIPDHDLVLSAVKGRKIYEAPKRAVFGLPHNYFYSSVFNEEKERLMSEGKKEHEAKRISGGLSRAGIGTNKRERDRRSAPFFIHVHQFPNSNEYFVFQVFMPATFIPAGDKVKISTKRSGSAEVKFQPDWDVIHDYLARFDKRESLL